MKIRAIFLSLLLMLFACTSVFAAAGGYEIKSNSGTEWLTNIIGEMVVVSYNTVGGSDRFATDNVQDLSVAAIHGFDPRWEQIPTLGIEPEWETATYNYQFMNVGNKPSSYFTVTHSVTFRENDPSVWDIQLLDENFNPTDSIILSLEEESPVLSLAVRGLADVLPGDYAVISFNIICDEQPTANPYVGDNAITYGGYGDQEHITTTTILIARIVMTKNVSVESPPEYQANGGSATAAVPGARLTYSVIWENIGSLPAMDIKFFDDLPDAYTTLTDNVTTVAINAIGGEVSYNVSGVYQIAPDPAALDFRVAYDKIPIAATGNFTYQVIIK